MVKIPEKELEILDFWKQNEIFKKSMEKQAPNGDYVFYEGPPTANGRPGLHHVLARSFKDIMCRYKTMRGYRVLRKAGWDTHGLPVEIEVEKQIGISGKLDIEKFGVEAFNRKCRESVWQYQEEWEKLTDRMGYWLDMEHPYITYTNDYIESVWWVVKEAWNKGLVYQGHKVVPHCPRCGTSLSSHEVAQGYKLVKEPSVFIKFKVTKGKGAVQNGDYILSWTTTPWTLPGNVALAIAEDVDYVRVQRTYLEPRLGYQLEEGKNPPESKMVKVFYILAKPLFEQNQMKLNLNEVKVVDEFKGSELVGIEYEPLFPGAIDPGEKKAWYVAPANFVTTADGTGVVHTAVMYGAEDYDLGMAMGLPAVHTVDEAGKFLPSVKQWAGQFVKSKKVEEGIIADLKERGLLLSVLDYEHDYPFCWRCDTPLLYYAKDSWFIKMTALKDDLLKNASEINWYPAHIKEGRFGEWLEGVKDWAISRERYWGTPMPIWKCESCGKFRCVGSIAELETDIKDLHRPYIDAVILKCDCGGAMKRAPEVLDAWLDSGSMPFAQHHYPFENKELIDSGAAFPAEYISEAIDQTRGWFYTLLAVSTILGKGASYKNVICLGHINDAQGKKMSKSKGNVINPFEMMDKYGADIVRYHLFTINQPGEIKLFDEKNLVETSRQVVMTLLNVMSFYGLYAKGDIKASADSKHIMDRWVIALLDDKINFITKELDAYNITEATRALGEFIQELSVWYIRRSRDRFKDEATQGEALQALKYVLLNLAKIMAPSMPFISEYLWKELGAEEAVSVHLAEWSKASGHDQQLLDHMQSVRSIVEKAHALRAVAGMKVRQPLQTLEITIDVSDELKTIIAEEVNVKEVISKSVLSFDAGWVSDEQNSIALLTTLSDDLKAEGTLRELVRTTNALRKEKGLKTSDSISVTYSTKSSDLKKVITNYTDQLCKQTIAVSWKQVDSAGTPTKVNGEDIAIYF